MAFLRRPPLVTTTIDLDAGPRAAAVTINPAAGRWPSEEGSDRLLVPLGLAALALTHASEDAVEPVRAQLRNAAAAIADRALADEELPTLSIAVSGLRLAAPGEAGATRVSARLVRSAIGPVSTLGRGNPPPAVLGSAATATLAAALAPSPMEDRLSAALALEGLLGWYAVADPRVQPPQQAVAYALRHAASRLAEEGRAVPGALAEAARRQGGDDGPGAGGA